MSFFRVDDQAFVHPKHQALMRLALGGDLLAMGAGYLWTLVGSRLRASYKDGVLDRVDLYSIYPDPQVEQMAERLVRVGLWHTDDTCCERCEPPGPGRWCFHDWEQWSTRTGEEDQLRRALQAERTDTRLHDRVWERDRLPPDHPGQADHALCVYCRTVVWRDRRKGDQAPEMDHVFGRPIGLDGVAIACRSCNRAKGNRSASKAGMTFHPTRPHAEALRARQHRSHPDGFADLLELAWADPDDAGPAVATCQRRSHPEPGRAEPLAGGGGSSLPADRPDTTPQPAQQPPGGDTTPPTRPGTSTPATGPRAGFYRPQPPAPTPAGSAVVPATDHTDGGPQPMDNPGPDSAPRARTRTGARTGPRASACALSRPAGQGTARHGTGTESGKETAQAKAAAQEQEAGQGQQAGQGRRRGRRRGRRSRRRPQAQQVCAEHGDRVPCRMCQYQDQDQQEGDQA